MKIGKDLLFKLTNWYSLAALLSAWISLSKVSDEPKIFLIIITTLIVLLFLIADSLINVKIESPLVSNKYVLFSIIFSVTGILLSLILNRHVFFLLLIVGVLLYTHRYLTERLFFLNILILAFLSGCIFWLSGAAVKPILISFFPGSIYPSLLIFLYAIIYLIISKTDGIEGNKSIIEIPFVKNLKSSQMILIVILFLFSMILLSYLPILKNWYSTTYKIILVYIVELPLMGFLIIVWGNPVKSMLSAAKIILKLDILLGLTALYFA